MKRRSLLTSAAATAFLGVSFAGCTELLGQPTEADGGGCAPGYREIDRAFPSTIPDNAPNGLTLQLSQRTVTPPDPVTATLENTADSSIEIYDTDRLAVQGLNSSEEWTTVLGVPDNYTWNDATTTLEAGGTREWEFGLERGGFPEPYERCTAFVPGRYRFVYWGQPDDRTPLAVPIEVQDT
jgi:hypothetical protein